MNTYEEQFCFESNLALNLENSLRNCFFNFRESNKFSPDLLSGFISYSKEKNIDNSFNADGIYYLDTYLTGMNYYLDIYSGLIFCKDGDRFKIAKGACASQDYDLIDAAYLRMCLNHPESKKSCLYCLTVFMK